MPAGTTEEDAHEQRLYLLRGADATAIPSALPNVAPDLGLLGNQLEAVDRLIRANFPAHDLPVPALPPVRHDR